MDDRLNNEMITIFIQLDEENRVISWGSSTIGENCVEVLIPEDHAFFNSSRSFIYINGELIKDDLHELKILRQQRFDELSKECETEIKGYFKVVLHDTEYAFSYDYEAQLNFTGTLILFNENQIDVVEWTAYNGDNVERITLDKTDFLIVTNEAFMHKNGNIHKLRNIIQPLLESCQTKEEINAIKWNDIDD
ncbi:hypothetical protein [Oceanobacillus kimchii]|uniref:DUF4376 domain-containing protein n=1 Tax=Oceanobacillus kimchii TaxID=746691 RepID=UPI003C750AE8